MQQFIILPFAQHFINVVTDSFCLEMEIRIPEQLISISTAPNEQTYVQYDYCAVMKCNEKDGGMSDVQKEILSSLSLAGLEMYCYAAAESHNLPRNTKYVFILLKIRSVEVMRHFAEFTGFRMKLDPLAIKRKCIEERKLDINDSPEYSSISPYENLFVKYDSRNDELFQKSPGNETAFRSLLRIKLIESIVEGKFGKDKKTSFKYLKHLGYIVDYFPMPNTVMLHDLYQDWISPSGLLPYNIPFAKIREYYGEKIELYFQVKIIHMSLIVVKWLIVLFYLFVQFLGHLTMWLLIPALAGAGFQYSVIVTQDFNNVAIPYYSVMIAGWSVLVLRYWQRKEKRISTEAGTTEVEEEEADRPEYLVTQSLYIVYVFASSNIICLCINDGVWTLTFFSFHFLFMSI